MHLPSRDRPDIILAQSLARDARFVGFLAVAAMIDRDAAAESLAWIESCRTAWLADHGPGELGDSELEDLLVDVVTTAASWSRPDRPLTLGLTGGYDSRPILHACRVAGLAPVTFTYGCTGMLDYDIVQLLKRSLGLDTLVFDTNAIEWSLADIDRSGLRQRDYPMSPRVPVSARMDEMHPRRVELHGHFNGLLTTRPYRPPASWEEALAGFAAGNDQFRLQQYLGDGWKRILPQHPITDPDKLAYDWQLRIAFRLFQRIWPLADNGRIYATPFTDKRWIGYWLSRPFETVQRQQRWIRFVHNLDSDLFPDLVPFRDETARWNLRNKRVALLYGDEDGPGLVDLRAAGLAIPESPTMHFSVHACYRNNPSFRAMVDGGLRRLRARRVFHDAFIDAILGRFQAGDADAAAAVNGLMAADRVLEAGLF